MTLDNAPNNRLLQRLALGLTFPLLMLNGWLGLKFFQFFQQPVSIFIAASILAFLLNYLVQFLTSRGVERGSAVVGVFLFAVSVIVAVGIILVPIALTQLTELARNLPSWIDSGRQQVQAFQTWVQDQNIQVDISGIVIQLTERLSGQLQNLTGKVLSIALDTASSVVNVLLTLVLSFYLLSWGDRILTGIFKWFPTELAHKIQQSLRQTFQNYYIGQATLATLNGVTLTTAFWLLKVPFGLLFGLAIGIMTLVPFGGAVTIGIVTLLVSLENFWLGMKLLGTAIVIDQAIGNAIAPRLLGNLTGLNPAWVLISLLIGVQLGGPLGLIIAVPIASFIKSTTDMLRQPKLEPILETTTPIETLTSV